MLSSEEIIDSLFENHLKRTNHGDFFQQRMTRDNAHGF